MIESKVRAHHPKDGNHSYPHRPACFPSRSHAPLLSPASYSIRDLALVLREQETSWQSLGPLRRLSIPRRRR